MNAPSIDIKDMLEDDTSLGLKIKVNLFIGFEPTTPGDCVTIFDTPGGPHAKSMDSEIYEYKAVQIRVRNTNYNTGYDLAEAIKTSLHGRVQETWNGALYTVILIPNGVFHLDWDENHRARFIINLNLQRR